MDDSLLDGATWRGPVNDDGRSGASLERVLLADGRRVVVKRYDPEVDLVMQMTGDRRGREVEVLASGLLGRLPAGVDHALLAGWYDADGHGTVVMRDLGASVLTWSDRLDATATRRVLDAVCRLHAVFLDDAPAGLTPLDLLVGLFEPRRLVPLAGSGLVDAALRGWELWPDVAPGEVGERVLALAQDTTPLVAALDRLPPTLLHGDLSTVNMAFEPDRPGAVTLIDWGTAARGPAELDLGRLLAGCGHLFDVPLDDLLVLHRAAAGPSYDEEALHLGLLAGLVWLGWNKALDIVDHPAEEVRERERTNLRWWLARAGRALETGLV